jgi:hypothetical protein
MRLSEESGKGIRRAARQERRRFDLMVEEYLNE